MPETKKVIEIQPWKHFQAILAKEASKTKRWQHEDTGRFVDMPVGKHPGRRWYRVPENA